MEERTPSITAATIAAHRAIESRKPIDSRICFDPLATVFLTPRSRVIGESSLPEGMALWIYERFFPGFHTYFAVRTRHIDDYLALCIENGLEQLVILGAGYDSRPYRFEKLRGQARVFEVDHPATQASKLLKLKTAFKTLPTHVTYVAIDFVKDSLDEKLYASGYNRNAKTLFIWEGVTYYLTANAVDQTLAFVVGNSGRGSSIIFDYTDPDVVAGTSPRWEGKAWRRVVRNFGEPLRFGLDAKDVASFLSQRGFHNIDNATHAAFKSAYLTGPNRNRSLTSIFGIVHAEV